jgi:hypothetical protein
VRILAVGCLFVFASALGAGPHEGGCYVDPCQSIDGRFVVAATLIEGKKGPGNAMIDHEWRFAWKDTKSGETHEGTLVGLRSGVGFGHQVHGHIFVAPDGETFAVWNARGYNPNPESNGSGVPGKNDWTDPAYQGHKNFDHRLVVYKKTGAMIKSFALKDFLKPEEWEGVAPSGSQNYWCEEINTNGRLGGYHFLPRSDYAFYNISPDYTVLQFVVSPWWESKLYKRLKEENKPMPRRTVHVDLVKGEILPGDWKSDDKNKIPVRPYVGEFLNVNRGIQQRFIPSLDPVRTPGMFPPELNIKMK